MPRARRNSNFRAEPALIERAVRAVDRVALCRAESAPAATFRYRRFRRRNRVVLISDSSSCALIAHDAPAGKWSRMPGKTVRIGIVAPATRIDPAVRERVTTLAAELYREPRRRSHFHPQCLPVVGPFRRRRCGARGGLRRGRQRSVVRRGLVRARRLWLVPHRRGRAAEADRRGAAQDLSRLQRHRRAARRRSTRSGFPHVAHGPMPADIAREGGEAAVRRALAYLVDRAPEALEPSSIAARSASPSTSDASASCSARRSSRISTGHVLMLEEVSEYMYRIDRALFHITSNPAIRRVAGHHASAAAADIPPNDPDFGQDRRRGRRVLVQALRHPLSRPRRHRPRHRQQGRAVRRRLRSLTRQLFSRISDFGSHVT